MPITVKSGFWGDTYAFKDGNNPLEKRVKHLFRKRGMQPVRELVQELLGAAAGATASVTYKRVGGNRGASDPVTTVGALGGVRVTETRTQINRVTTAADDTRITNLITRRNAPLTYPGDRSGNGK